MDKSDNMKIALRFYVFVGVLVGVLVSAAAVADLVPLNSTELASHVGGQVWLAEAGIEAGIGSKAINGRGLPVERADAQFGSGQVIAGFMAPQVNEQVTEKRAGITLDIYLQLSIGELRWTDPDGVGPNGQAGFVSLTNIKIGG